MSKFVEGEPEQQESPLDRAIGVLENMAQKPPNSLDQIVSYARLTASSNAEALQVRENEARFALALQGALKGFVEGELTYIQNASSLESRSYLDAEQIQRSESKIAPILQFIGATPGSPEDERIKSIITAAHKNSAQNKLNELVSISFAPSLYVGQTLEGHVVGIREQFALGGVDVSKDPALDSKIKEAGERFNEDGTIRWRIDMNGRKLDMSGKVMEDKKPSVGSPVKGGPKSP